MQLTNSTKFGNLQAALFSGVTTAIVSLSLSLDFGVTSGTSPVADLYGAVCVGFFTVLFGNIPTLTLN